VTPEASRAQRLRGLAARYLPDVLFALLSLGILVWVSWDAFSFRLVSFNAGADYWEHTAVLHALLIDPIHPGHPLIASDIGSPRYNPHLLLAALLSRPFTDDALDAMGVSAVLNTALFCLGIGWFCRAYFRDSRAAFVGLVVFFGAWYDAPHFSNVYELDIFFSVAGYPSTAALGMTMIGLALTTKVLRSSHTRWPWLLGLTLLWADVYITHPLTATMGLSACVLLALTEPGVVRRDRLRVGGTALLGFLLAGFWPYYPALSMVARGTAARVQRELELGTAPLHQFYSQEMLFRIVGYSLLALPVLAYFLVRRRHLFAPLSALLMILVFVVSAFLDIPLGHRYVLLAMPFLHIALVWLLLSLVPRAGTTTLLARRPVKIVAALAVAGFLSFLAVTNVSMAHARFAKVSPSFTPRESPTVRLGRRVAEITGRDAVVLATPLSSWSLPTFGPKIVALHHTNPMIGDSAARKGDVMKFLAAGTRPDERRRILEHYAVTHVLASAPLSRSLARFLKEHGTEHPLPGRATLYAVRGPSPRHAADAVH
jgi:hypothetical protein